MNGQQRVCLLVGGLVAAILIATLGLASWTIPDRHVSYETNTLAEGAPVSSLPFQTTIDGGACQGTVTIPLTAVAGQPN